MGMSDTKVFSPQQTVVPATAQNALCRGDPSANVSTGCLPQQPLLLQPKKSPFRLHLNNPHIQCPVFLYIHFNIPRLKPLQVRNIMWIRVILSDCEAMDVSCCDIWGHVHASTHGWMYWNRNLCGMTQKHCARTNSVVKTHPMCNQNKGGHSEHLCK